jgi:hypothetical protein
MSAESDTTDRQETARLYFEKARDEAITRLSHREQGLFIFMTALAAFAGVLLATPQWYPVLLVVPFLSIGTALILLQHDIVIGILARYQKKDLEPFLASPDQRQGPPERVATLAQWELSDSLKDYGALVLQMRNLGHYLLLVAPSFAALAIAAALFFFPIETRQAQQDPKAAVEQAGDDAAEWTLQDVAWNACAVAIWFFGAIAAILSCVLTKLAHDVRTEIASGAEAEGTQTLWSRILQTCRAACAAASRGTQTLGSRILQYFKR